MRAVVNKALASSKIDFDTEVSIIQPKFCKPGILCVTAVQTKDEGTLANHERTMGALTNHRTPLWLATESCIQLWLSLQSLASCFHLF